MKLNQILVNGFGALTLILSGALGAPVAQADGDICFRQEQVGTKQECTSVSEQQCREVPRQACRDTTRRECTDTTRRECTPTSRQECSNITRRECTDTHRRECSEVTRRECKPGPRVCDKVTERKCEMKRSCRPNPADPQCADSLLGRIRNRHCSSICEDKEECKDVVVEKNCRNEGPEVCRDIRENVCREVPGRSCRDVSDRVCREVPDTACRDVADQVCREVPDQICNTVTDRVCNDVPGQQCREVPVYEQVPYQCGASGPVAPQLSSTIIYVNGVQLRGAKVYESQAKLLVPIRALFETLGAEVQYLPADQRIIAKLNGKTVEMAVGSKIAVRDGKRVAIDLPPTNIGGGSVYIPLRFAAESLNAEVRYDAQTKTVHISTN